MPSTMRTARPDETDSELGLLRQATRELVTSRYTGWPDETWPESWPSTWQDFADLGLWSTLDPPDGSLAAAAVVAEELGRALYPGPTAETLAGAHVLGALGRLDRAAIAAPDPGQLVVFTEETDQRFARLVEIPRAALLLIATPANDLRVMSAADIGRKPMATIDVSRRFLELDPPAGCPAPLTSTTGRELASHARAALRLLYCADTLGGLERVVHQTTEYAKQRTTFGSPVGKYQAVAHRLVDHAVAVRQMRLLLSAAVAAFDNRAPDLERRVASAHMFFGEHAADVVSDCIQLSGAIGFTWEYGHHFYLRRAVQNAAIGGANPGARDPLVFTRAIGSPTAAPIPGIAEFRGRVRDFIGRQAPPGQCHDGQRVPRTAAAERALRRWYAALFGEGYIGGSWPVQYGGRAGQTPYHDAVVMEEIVRARVPRPIDQVLLAAHLIITFGSPAQRARYLPRIRSARDIWCQLFSEPGVGSDLARLTTKAVRLSDGNFRIDGQKVWSTDAQWAQMGVLLARTDPAARPHAGLTVFLVDMSSPGIDIRPIREMTGSAEFCEVYLDGVVVPADSVLGGVNRGWNLVNSGLASERAYVGANAVMLELLFDDLVELAGNLDYPGGAAVDDPVVRQALADFGARVSAVGCIAADALDRVARGGPADPADGLIAKLAYTECNVAMCAYAMSLAASGRLRPSGAGSYERWRHAFLWSRALTISGGSSEIIRNVLATQLLGLPRSW